MILLSVPHLPSCPLTHTLAPGCFVYVSYFSLPLCPSNHVCVHVLHKYFLSCRFSLPVLICYYILEVTLFSFLSCVFHFLNVSNIFGEKWILFLYQCLLLSLFTVYHFYTFLTFSPLIVLDIVIISSRKVWYSNTKRINAINLFAQTSIESGHLCDKSNFVSPKNKYCMSYDRSVYRYVKTHDTTTVVDVSLWKEARVQWIQTFFPDTPGFQFA